MHRTLTPALAGLATMALCWSASAQHLDPLHYDGDLGRYTYDLESHQSAPTAPNTGIDALVTSFANTGTSGFFALPALGEEWVDFGSHAGLSGWISGIQIGYGTLALDVSAGGPGAAMDISIYSDGSTTTPQGGCVLATEVIRLSLTGLPGSTTGGAAGYIVDIDIGSAAARLGSGFLAWGYTNADGNTGPLLINVGCCGTGTSDAFDIYSPGPATAGNCAGTFAFSTPGIASFYLALTEDDGSTPASSVSRNGSGTNPNVFTETASARIGTAWDTHVDASGFPLAVLSAIALSSRQGTPIPAPGLGEILVDVLPPNPFLIWMDGLLSDHWIPVPNDTGLVGVVLYTQAAIVEATGAITLTNALDITVGT